MDFNYFKNEIAVYLHHPLVNNVSLTGRFAESNSGMISYLQNELLFEDFIDAEVVPMDFCDGI